MKVVYRQSMRQEKQKKEDRFDFPLSCLQYSITSISFVDRHNKKYALEDKQGGG